MGEAPLQGGSPCAFAYFLGTRKVRLHLLCIGCGMQAHFFGLMELVMVIDLFLVAGVVLILLGLVWEGLVCIGLAWLVWRASR